MSSRSRIKNRVIKINNSPVVQQLRYSVTGDVVASLMGGVATIMISRRLGPASFGLFSAGFALTQILVRVNDLGLSMATSKFIGESSDHQQQRVFYSLITKYRLLLSLLIIVVGVITTGLVLNLENRAVFMAAVVVSLATVYFEHLRFTLLAVTKVKASSMVNLIQGVIKIVVAGVAFVSQSVSVLIVFLLYMTAPMVPVLFKRTWLPNWIQLDLMFISDKQVLQLQGFVKHSAISIVSAGIVENADVLFAAYFLSEFETGLYGGVTKIAMFLYIVSYAIGNVLNPRVAGYGQEQLRNFQKKAVGGLILCVAGLIALLPLSKLLIQYTIGPEFLQATNVLRVLLASGLVSIALMPFQAIFYALDENWYFSLTGITQVLIIVVGGILMTPVYGILGLAWLRLVSRIVLLAMAAGIGWWKVNQLFTHSTTR